MTISEEKLRHIRQLIGVQEGISVDAPILHTKTIRQVAQEIQQLLTPEPQPQPTPPPTTKHKPKTKHTNPPTDPNPDN